MNLTFSSPGFDYSMESIMLFQTGDTSEHWSGPLFDFFPQLDRAVFVALPINQREAYLRKKLHEVYGAEEDSLIQKVQGYNAHWSQRRDDITAALSHAFGVDCGKAYDDIRGKITLNPICPRFLDTHTFDIFYKYSEKGAVNMAIHEIIHFVWFDVWQRHFCDDPAEYETPSLKWLFSEAAVDAIIRNESHLAEEYPYTEYAYTYFYDIELDAVPLMDRLNEIYKSTDIIGFMEKGFELFTAYEAEIRKHVK